MDNTTANHYNEANHGSPSSANYVGFKKVMMSTRGGDILKKLVQREMFWIYTIYTMTPNGFNDDIYLFFHIDFTSNVTGPVACCEL